MEKSRKNVSKIHIELYKTTAGGQRLKFIKNQEIWYWMASLNLVTLSIFEIVVNLVILKILVNLANMVIYVNLVMMVKHVILVFLFIFLGIY